MSGTEKTTIYYWDACAYLAWLKDERDAYGDAAIDALGRIIKENFDRNAAIATSTITLIEVLSSSLTEEQEKRFRGSFRPANHVMYDVDPPVALKAREFRERFRSGKKLPTADAIHLATAVICRANVLITFDEGKKDKQFVGLLGLSKDQRVDSLEISRPESVKPPPPPPEPDLFVEAQQPELGE